MSVLSLRLPPLQPFNFSAVDRWGEPGGRCRQAGGRAAAPGDAGCMPMLADAGGDGKNRGSAASAAAPTCRGRCVICPRQKGGLGGDASNANEGLLVTEISRVTIRWQELPPACVPPRTASRWESIAGGQAQQPRVPPSAGSTAHVPPVMHPPRSIPGGLWAGSQPTRPSPRHRPAARTGSPSTQGLCRTPWGSPSWDYTGFSHLLFHPASSPGHVRGSLALFIPLHLHPPWPVHHGGWVLPSSSSVQDAGMLQGQRWS